MKQLIGYINTGWGSDSDTRRSMLGYVFSLGSGAISWSTKRQVIVTFFIYEAKTIKQT
jgi:hypothetical protein